MSIGTSERSEKPPGPGQPAPPPRRLWSLIQAKLTLLMTFLWLLKWQLVWSHTWQLQHLSASLISGWGQQCIFKNIQPSPSLLVTFKNSSWRNHPHFLWKYASIHPSNEFWVAEDNSGHQEGLQRTAVRNGKQKNGKILADKWCCFSGKINLLLITIFCIILNLKDLSLSLPNPQHLLPHLVWPLLSFGGTAEHVITPTLQLLFLPDWKYWFCT